MTTYFLTLPDQWSSWKFYSFLRSLCIHPWWKFPLDTSRKTLFVSILFLFKITFLSTD
jgi:hypothetical protein